MEETKKMEEAAKPEEVAERTPLTDEQLDQASGGVPVPQTEKASTIIGAVGLPFG